MTGRWRAGRFNGIVRSSVAFTAATQAGTAGLSLLSGPMLSRALGADGRGVVAGVTVVIALLSWVCFLGLPQALGFHAGDVRSRFVTQMAIIVGIVGAVIAIVLWFAAPSIARNGPAIQVDGLRLGALVMPFCGIALCGQEVAYASGRLVRWNLMRSIPTAGASVSVVCLFAADKLSVTTGLGSYLGALIVYCLVGSIQLLRSASRDEPTVRLPVAFRYAATSWMASSSLLLFGRLDQVLMVPFSTADRLGRYAVAVTVVGSANLVPVAIGIVSYSRSRLAKDQVVENWETARRRLYVVGGLANMLVVVVGPWLVPVLFGQDFRGLGRVILLLALGQLINDIWTLRVNTLSGVGLQRKAVVPSWLSTVVFAGVLMLFAKSGGITELEASLATLSCAMVRPIFSRLSSGRFVHVLERANSERALSRSS